MDEITPQIELGMSHPWRDMGAVTGLASLAACGGGGGSSGSPAPPTGETPAPPPVVTLKHTPEEASRFLAQAAIGANRPLIDNIARNGIEHWIDNQFQTARPFSHYDWLVENGFTQADNWYSQTIWQKPLWKGLFTGSDQLRQRVTLALLDTFVVGIGFIEASWRSFALANYLDVLADNCFGNFRTLLFEITYSTAMGSFLTYIDSRKADAKGRMPDENYAREVMQLFTIGLQWLEEDGSLRLDASGRPIPTYTQEDVSQLSRVFTGLNYASEDRSDHSRHRKRMVFDPKFNDTGRIPFLGFELFGGGEQALTQALDLLVAHPNTGPFFGKRLIQSLVTSNPSPAYIKRVAQKFADNGSGVRGDLKAVIKAVLLDPEARTNPAGNPGRLRAPVLRYLQWGRAFAVRDPNDEWKTPSVLQELGHAPGWSPTVFNFFRPQYSPPLTQIRQQGLLAPEFELASEQKVVSYINFMKQAVGGDLAYFGITPDLSAYRAAAEQPRQLVDELALVLAAGQLSSATRDVIASAVASVAGTGVALLDNRIALATLLVLAAPEYLVLE